tara:strand:+ start:175 stop:390 length:216 start_codon:yes stop_codon:yes gene_type:complete
MQFGSARPIAKMSISISTAATSSATLLNSGTWQICYPLSEEQQTTTVTFKGVGDLTESWQVSNELYFHIPN